MKYSSAPKSGIKEEYEGAENKEDVQTAKLEASVIMGAGTAMQTPGSIQN